MNILQVELLSYGCKGNVFSLKEGLPTLPAANQIGVNSDVIDNCHFTGKRLEMELMGPRVDVYIFKNCHICSPKKICDFPLLPAIHESFPD